MPGDDHDHPTEDPGLGLPAINCEGCESILRAVGPDAVSYLLLDTLRIPVVGCPDHLGRFRSICGVTTDATAELLEHRPAGGLTCPACQQADHAPGQPLIPVQDGAVALIACPEHTATIVDRFQTGLATHQQLTTDLNTPPHQQ